MSDSLTIVVEHVRCFAERQEVELRPLTLLVGENSSGKTSFLGIVSAVLDASSFPFRPAFNESPYSLGTFDSIATYKGGRYGRDESFKIGLRQESLSRCGSIEATYKNDRGNPVLAEIASTVENVAFHCQLDGSHVSATITQKGRKEGTYEFEYDSRSTVDRRHSIRHLFWEIEEQFVAAARDSGADVRRTRFRALSPLVRFSFQFDNGSVSLSPIRSRPQRTYDIHEDQRRPEGDHVPALLARILDSQEATRDAGNVRKAIEDFGEESGLFRTVNVKRLGKGKSTSGPFQIEVSIGGPPVNLIDVGYGISQSLPVIVDVAMGHRHETMLIQQPEVHLHPRAQAALGTFFARMASKSTGRLVVETHSDHLLDRVRMEVAKGTISKDRVQILFFDRQKLHTTIHRIELDDQGNVVDPPESYRQFFLEEQYRLFDATAGGA